MDSQDITKAIQFLRPTAEFSFTDNDYSTIKWDVLEGNAPTWDEIQAASVLVAQNEEADKVKAAAKKQALLDRLGLTADELRIVLT